MAGVSLASVELVCDCVGIPYQSSSLLSGILPFPLLL